MISMECDVASLYTGTAAVIRNSTQNSLTHPLNRNLTGVKCVTIIKYYT